MPFSWILILGALTAIFPGSTFASAPQVALSTRGTDYSEPGNKFVMATLPDDAKVTYSIFSAEDKIAAQTIEISKIQNVRDLEHLDVQDILKPRFYDIRSIEVRGFKFKISTSTSYRTVDIQLGNWPFRTLLTEVPFPEMGARISEWVKQSQRIVLDPGRAIKTALYNCRLLQATILEILSDPAHYGGSEARATLLNDLLTGFQSMENRIKGIETNWFYRLTRKLRIRKAMIDLEGLRLEFLASVKALGISHGEFPWIDETAMENKIGLIETGESGVERAIFFILEKDITDAIVLSSMIDFKPRIQFENVAILVPMKKGGRRGVAKLRWSLSYEDRSDRRDRKTQVFETEFNNDSNNINLINSLESWKTHFLGRLQQVVEAYDEDTAKNTPDPAKKWGARVARRVRIAEAVEEGAAQAAEDDDELNDLPTAAACRKNLTHQ